MMTQLGKLLERITGMNPAVLGEKRLAGIVRERMSACGLEDEEQYLERARSSSQEMEALIEITVIPETSFFRDKSPFAFLRKYVCDEWIRGRKAGPLRILSAPCSSGEEPYSIAMTLREAGLEPDKYKLDALDISRVLLRKAKDAVYTPYSFRGVPELLRERYFVRKGDEYALKDTVRHAVRFIHGNLLDDRVLSEQKLYDIVFCRNLMIYLGAEARARMVNSIERLLIPNGLLFVGHAETSCFPTTKLALLDQRKAFCLRKIEDRTASAAPALTETFCPNAASPRPIHNTRKSSRKAKQPVPHAAGTPGLEDSFEEARQLADQGRLSEAAAMCKRLLQADEANAGLYCLLGTVLHGLGDLQSAEEYFNRAIYLDARCYDAVMHLSLIKEHRGDFEGAEVLRHRAARIRP